MSDELPDMDLQPASVITSEFTLASIRYIAILESAVEISIATGTAAYVAMFGTTTEDARQRFMSAAARSVWSVVDERRDIYRNLLEVMSDEVRKWEKEKNDGH